MIMIISAILDNSNNKIYSYITISDVTRLGVNTERANTHKRTISSVKVIILK